MVLHTGYPCHPGNYQRGRAQPVSFLVYHYVGATGGGKANAKYYHSADGVGASAHYFVGHASEGAEIWSSVPEADTAWHCGAKTYKHRSCRNANSIGIEMCCHQRPDGTWYIDEETMVAAAELGRDIMARYAIPMDHVLRHYDVTGKLCPRPLIDEGAWADFKKRLEVDDDMLTPEQFSQMMDNWMTQNREKPESDWAKAAWAKAVAAGIFDGTAPQNPLTREQAAQVLERLGLIGK